MILLCLFAQGISNKLTFQKAIHVAFEEENENLNFFCIFRFSDMGAPFLFSIFSVSTFFMFYAYLETSFLVHFILKLR